MSVTIRLAQNSDIPHIAELIPLSARKLQATYYSSAQIEGALGTVFAVDSQLIIDGTYFVAEACGQIVGCGGWSQRNALFGGDRSLADSQDILLDPTQEESARIRAFFVHPDWSRRGIGTRIMQTCEDAAIQAGFKKIELVATLAGEPLYTAFDYHAIPLCGQRFAIARFEIPLSNGIQLPVVRMKKNLKALIL